MSESERSDPFEPYRTTEAEIVSHARDGFTVDINGTQVHFRQREHVPVLIEIWIEDDDNPIGSINVAKGCTVSLGGVSEGLTDNVERQIGELEGVLAELEELEYRLNPEGKLSPQMFLTRPGQPRFGVVCECGETWYPHKSGNYNDRYSDGPWCPHCSTDWRELEGADEYTDEDGNPSFQRDEDGNWRSLGTDR